MFRMPPFPAKSAVLALALGLAASAALAGEFVFVPDDATHGLKARGHRLFDTFLVRPGTDFQAYSGVRIGAVTVRPVDARVDKRMNSIDRRQLVRKFRSYVSGGLGDAANGDGPKLVLSAAIIDAMPNNDITGRYLQSRGASPSSSSTAIGVGSVSFEGILKDARTGEVVAVLADKYTGRNFSANVNLHTRWGDADEGFRRWGKELRKLVGGTGRS